MGCFLGCFSSSKERKRRKHRYRAIRRDQDPKSQNLVQADVSLVQSIKDKPCDSLSELRGKNEEPLNYEDENDDDLDDEEDYDDEDGITCQEVWRESIPDVISSSESRIESSLNPVLKPVENLAQWKALKLKGTVTQPPKPLDSNPQKENFSFNSIPFPPKNWNQEIAVDASLNWLVSTEKNSPNNKRAGYYSPDVEPVSSGKCFSQESTITSVKSIEDRPMLGALTADELKQFSGSSCTPRKSPGRSPDDMPIIGSVGSYWSHTGSAQSLSSTSSYNGIPNATSKYREDKKVNWQNTPFETRLERALNGDCTEC
ncbi:hypothetical protein L1987_50594 [Smallanthus sonchifolius]|uniref:Uncharacterized protein n=1 Tax=Smallanthus sonchifolius TaxID=185202 RepID=A0ACB9ENR3_9ASTR|nr:hypothetical protein L1987_50594 [Smallanthus sonchifolius]